MITIWKYEIPVEDTFSVDMPAYATILTVQVQNDVPCMWAAVDTERGKVKRTFHVIGTGHDASRAVWSWPYVGTFQLDGGSYIGHLFEEHV